MLREIARDPGAAFDQAHQLRDRHGMFVKQRQIGGTPDNTVKQRDQALKPGIRGIRCRYRREQHGH